MKKLVIFSDYGLDDAIALIYLLDNSFWNKIDVVAIAGNTTAENSLNNLKKLLCSYGELLKDKNLDKNYCNKIKSILNNINIIDTVEHKQPSDPLPDIHGVDGMGDLISDELVASCPCRVLKWNDWLATHDGTKEYDILSLGPATMVMPFIKKLKTEAGKKTLKESHLWMMGHHIKAQPNYNNEEFNYGLDADSFDWCIDNTQAKIATLDTCRVEYFNLVNACVKTKNGLYDKLLNKAIHLARVRHNDNAYIYDQIAARALINPQSFNTIREVDKKGRTINHLVSNK